MNHRTLALTICLFTPFTVSPVMGESTLHCPDLAQAKQITECPDEAEVRRMFKLTCSFERDPNAKKPEICDSYAEFKRRKFTSLWESSDGSFMGYVNCALPTDVIAAAKPESIAVSQKNGLYRIACNYRDGVKFTLRTRSVCGVPGVHNPMIVMRADCRADSANCKAVCE